MSYVQTYAPTNRRRSGMLDTEAAKTAHYSLLPNHDPESPLQHSRSLSPGRGRRGFSDKGGGGPMQSMSRRTQRRIYVLLSLVGLTVCIVFVVLHASGRATIPGSVNKWISKFPTSISGKSNGLLTYQSSQLSKPLRDLSKKTVLATKTGYAEMFDHLPMQLIEPRPDIPNSYVYSDVETQFGTTLVQDALKNLSREIKESEKFKGYVSMHQAMRDRVPLDGDWPQGTTEKYKYLPMHGDMYRRHPDAAWYVAVDGDTFLFWSTLLRFLSRFDSNDQLFFGLEGANGIDGAGTTGYAVSGGGYVLSQGVMEHTYKQSPWEFENSHAAVLEEVPLGEMALARAIYSSPGNTLKRTLSGGVGLFTQQSPRDLEFTAANWLSPLFSLHEVGGYEVHDLYDFEKKRLAQLQYEDGIRYCDLFEHFAPAFLSTALAMYESQTMPDHHLQRRGWNTFGTSQIYYGPGFAEMYHRPYDIHLCEYLCDQAESCMTWVWEDNYNNGEPRCTMSVNSIKMGKPVKTNDVTSGWRLDRLARLSKSQDCNNLQTRKLADLDAFGLPGTTLYPFHQLSEADQEKYLREETDYLGFKGDGTGEKKKIPLWVQKS